MDCPGSSISNNKRETIRQLRNNLKDLLTDEHTDTLLLKWLRVRKFDVKKTELLFREVYENRITYGINNITETFVRPKVINKYERTWFLGFAKDGSPVRYIDLHMDLIGFANSVSMHDLTLYFAHFIEKDIKALKKRNKDIKAHECEVTYIFNVDGFSLQDVYSKAVIEEGLDIFTIYQEHYPETWRYFLFVNAPYIFEKALNLFKPVLGPAFMEKIKITTKGDATVQLLRDLIDDEELPAFLGGSRVDSKGDPLCREYLKGYHKIPEDYYHLNCLPLISEGDPGVSVVTLRARRVHNGTLLVKDTRDKMRLEMRTEKGSIHFAIFHRTCPPDAQNVEFSENEEYYDRNDEHSDVRIVGSRIRVQSHLAPYDGTFNASRPGLYIFQFDNTASWVGSRKLYYRLTIVPPEDLGDPLPEIS